MNNNIKEEIHFLDENIFEIIAEILSKIGLEETLEDAAENDDSAILFVFDLIKNFVKEVVSEKDIIASLQTKLKISPEAAKTIFQGIKEKILPRVEKITIEAQREKPAPTMAGGQNDVALNKNLDIIEQAVALKFMPPSEKNKSVMKNSVEPPKIKKKKMPNLPKKPDNYREPIE